MFGEEAQFFIRAIDKGSRTCGRISGRAGFEGINKNFVYCMNFTCLFRAHSSYHRFKTDLMGPIDQLYVALEERLASTIRAAEDRVAFWRSILGIAVAMILAVSAAAAWLLVLCISKPLDELSGSMDRLAKGDLAVRIPHAERVNEIGDMSRATTIFRDGLVETAKLPEAEAKRGAELEAARRAAIQEIASDLEKAIGQSVAMLSDNSVKLAVEGGKVASTSREPGRAIGQGDGGDSGRNQRHAIHHF